MKKVAIITDSIASIPPEVVKKYDITISPLHAIMDGKDYLDTTINRTEKEQIYQRIMSRQNLPTSAAPVPAEVLQAFKQISQKGIKSIAYITMTTGFSATYKFGLQAKEMAKEELPGIAIEVLDTQTVAGGQALVVIEAAKVASQGKSLAEVVEVANKIKQKVTEFWIPDALFYFDKGGRLGRAKPLAGSPVPLAVVLAANVSTGGVVNPASKHRTVAKAVENAVLLMKQRSQNKKLHVVVGHIFKPDSAEELKQKVLSLCQPVELYFNENSIVTGVLNGPYVDLGFFTED